MVQEDFHSCCSNLLRCSSMHLPTDNPGHERYHLYGLVQPVAPGVQDDSQSSSGQIKRQLRFVLGAGQLVGLGIARAALKRATSGPFCCHACSKSGSIGPAEIFIAVSHALPIGYRRFNLLKFWIQGVFSCLYSPIDRAVQAAKSCSYCIGVDALVPTNASNGQAEPNPDQ